MKKTYIIPEMLSVQLGTCKMMAESPLSVTNDGDTYNLGDGTAPEGDDAMAKGVSDKNIWDEEW